MCDGPRGRVRLALLIGLAVAVSTAHPAPAGAQGGTATELARMPPSRLATLAAERPADQALPLRFRPDEPHPLFIYSVGWLPDATPILLVVYGAARADLPPELSSPTK